MFHRTILRLGCTALVFAIALMSVPAAMAQKGHAGGHSGGGHAGGAHYGGGHYGGGYSGGGHYGGGHYGGHNYGYPFLGFGIGLGYGLGYPFGGNYGGYYGNPGYYSSAPAYDYYYSPPGYNAYTAPDATPPVTTQSFYAPPPTTARITVQLPADATLWVDDMPTTQTGAVRQFVTPGTLQPGQTYHYTLKAQWMENGQPVVRERKLDFQAGNQIVVNLTLP